MQSILHLDFSSGQISKFVLDFESIVSNEFLNFLKIFVIVTIL